MSSREGLSCTGSRLSLATFILLGCCSGLGVLGKIPLLHSVFHLPSAVLAACCGLLICLPLLFNVALKHSRLASLVFVLILAFACLIVFPKVSALHSVGHGSDQADCVIVASKRLASLRWPYDRSLLWSHNAMSCGPGWVLLQIPILKIFGYGATQFLLCILSLAAIWQAEGAEFALAFTALIGLCPGIWLCAANGSDFLAFGIGLSAIVISATSREGRSNTSNFLLIIIAGLFYQFRMPFVVMPGLLRKSVGLWTSSLIAFIAISTQIAFFAWDPFDYIDSGPMHLIKKTLGNSSSVTSAEVVSIVLSFVCVLVLTLWLGGYFRPDVTSLSFLLVFLGIPAVVDLSRKFHGIASPLRALGTWEGGPWLAACVPLAALMTLSYLFPSSLRGAGVRVHARDL